MDLGKLVNQFTGGNAPQGAHPELGGWLQNYQQGNYNQVPHDQVNQAYNQWAQQATPEQTQQALNYGFQQVPPQQQPGVANSLINMFQHHGLNPQAAGVQTTDPNQMSPNDMARLANHAQQQQPDAFKQLFQQGGALSNPLVGMAVAGGLAYAATQFMGRK